MWQDRVVPGVWKQTNVNWNKNLTDKNAKSNFGAGITMNLQGGGKLKRQFLRAYPGLKEIYGRSIKIVKDPNFTQGFGNIEFFTKDKERVDYRTDEEWEKDIAKEKIVKNPAPKKEMAVLMNPNKTKGSDAFLDLYSHGISGNMSDEKLAKMYQDFYKATVAHQGNDIKYFYDQEVARGNTGDGYKAYEQNWVDGSLSTMEALKLDPSNEDYKEGRKYLSQEQMKLANEISDYLRTKKR